MQRHRVRYWFSWRLDGWHNIGLIRVLVIKDHHHHHVAVADQHRALSKVVSPLHLGRHHTSAGWNSLSQVSLNSKEVRGIIFPQLVGVGNTLLLDGAAGKKLIRLWWMELLRHDANSIHSVEASKFSTDNQIWVSDHSSFLRDISSHRPTLSNHPP